MAALGFAATNVPSCRTAGKIQSEPSEPTVAAICKANRPFYQDCCNSINGLDLSQGALWQEHADVIDYLSIKKASLRTALYSRVPPNGVM